MLINYNNLEMFFENKIVELDIDREQY